MAEKKVKRKINKKGVLVVLLTLYLIIMAFYYCFTIKIKNIIIDGNKQISDAEIIEASGLAQYPKLFKLSNKKIANNILSINEIAEAKVSKNIFGKVTIKISENKVLFFNKLNDTYVLSDQTEVKQVQNNLGIPVLVNYVQSDIYASLIKKMSNIDRNIISLISEIKYDPDVKNGITLDDSRFLLRMNDGNFVYINLANFDNISNYELIYIALEEKGVINLDLIYSGSTNISFKSFEAIKKAEEEQKEEKDE